MLDFWDTKFTVSRYFRYRRAWPADLILRLEGHYHQTLQNEINFTQRNLALMAGHRLPDNHEGYELTCPSGRVFHVFFSDGRIDISLSWSKGESFHLDEDQSLKGSIHERGGS